MCEMIACDGYLLREGILQLLHDHAAQVAHHVLQRLGAEHAVRGVGLARRRHQHHRLLPHARRELLDRLLQHSSHLIP